jgi:orotate phosphoribosyltransferase
MNDWRQKFERANALWMYDGEPHPSKPHALLTSGKHSSGYFNGTNVVCHPGLTQDAASAMHAMALPAVENFVFLERRLAWVFGSAMGAITLAHELAKKFRCQAGYTEKDGDNMVVKRFEVGVNDSVLVCEDVMTTGGTTIKTTAALEKMGAKIVPFIPVLVNRSGHRSLDSREVMGLVNRDLPIWTPEACPYCQAGSTAVKPKENWADLVGSPAT